ncbi:MAG TPA: NAD(P)/FAD-dependent oxidoreductase [Mucilaginibacter sp.]|jgi:NADH dehydrogenase|nr:NAD(P)/FAD-dependent oxidoreductase [Mucilaginibacter sp.]
MNLKDKSTFPRVVIVGGGFGGLQVAKKLADKPVEVLMIDKHNYHTFQPLLYQVAIGSLEADSIAFSLRKNFAGQQNFSFRNAEVTRVNPDNNTIETTIGEISFDYLVLATGSTTNFFGNKEIERFAMSMKSIPEALDLRSMILQNIEEAVLFSTKEEREPYLNFVLVGAGPTGVELSGALAELRNHILTQDYPELSKDHMKVYLVDFMPRVLGAFSEEASKKAKKFLTSLGVEVLLNVKVESYDGDEIKFEDGKRIRTKNVIWSAGVMGVVPDGIPKKIIERGNKLRTDSICRVDGYSNIFAIGDVAAMITEETPKGHPGVAQVAIQQGNFVAKTVIQLINGEPTEPFKYFDKGSLATIGRNKAVADLGKLKFQGFFAWLIWMFVHLVSLLGFRNKIIVFINWSASYLSYNGGARLIIRRFVKPSLTQKTHLPKTDH